MGEINLGLKSQTKSGPLPDVPDRSRGFTGGHKKKATARVKER
jgi:hypothetical protein